MRLEIEKISIEEIRQNPSSFKEKYWALEKPVIIVGIKLPVGDMSSSQIKERFLTSANKELGWYEAELSEDLSPSFIFDVIDYGECALRKKPMRVFAQPRGHQTFAHYDGNSLVGFNYQYIGKKNWVIVSPETPLKSIPFMYVAMGRELSELPEIYNYYNFDLQQGEMLFLPRYWQHQVTSLDEVNINFNWVMTPKMPNDSVLGRRECEIIKLRESLPIVNRAFFPEPIANYGGVGKELTVNYTKSIGIMGSLKRLLLELSQYPQLLFHAAYLKKEAARFEKNNFNI